jgi:hypothetical protein
MVNIITNYKKLYNERERQNKRGEGGRKERRREVEMYLRDAFSGYRNYAICSITHLGSKVPTI